MAVPKHKVSKSQKRIRQNAKFFATTTQFTNCPKCHEAVRPHCVCMACGYYKGRKCIEVAEDTAS
ncbi:MAG: 50S ribosomal protein L32 [Firmicutes bacterium]|nr:50S ribosomal protein L32 [Bacillota bacterium]